MEDEARPLPKGWVRTFDPESDHQFYVDTTVDPPRSIWHHPYDDDEYLAKLPAAEREQIEQESMSSYLGNAKHDPSMEDYIHSHSDIEDDSHQHAPSGSAAASSSSKTAELPPRPEGKGKGKDPNRSFGRKLKDKVTGTTHEERQQQRVAREAEEQRMYEQHMRIRKAMTKAMQTGEPQPIGKDKDGKELYISPPKQPTYASGGYGGGMGLGSYGNPYNPYSSGMYAAPGMYSRPVGPYSRPMYGDPYGYGGGYGYGRRGYGYGGGGMGFPLALGGGLLAGGLLGGALF
jgi:hypothetical protein